MEIFSGLNSPVQGGHVQGLFSLGGAIVIPLKEEPVIDGGGAMNYLRRRSRSPSPSGRSTSSRVSGLLFLFDHPQGRQGQINRCPDRRRFIRTFPQEAFHVDRKKIGANRRNPPHPSPGLRGDDRPVPLFPCRSGGAADRAGRPAKTPPARTFGAAISRPQKPVAPAAPTEAKIEEGDNRRLVRLSEIARSINEPGAAAGALTTEAARLCGFSIRAEDRSKIAEPD